MKPITLKINTQLETYPIIIGPNIIKDLSKYLKKTSINFDKCLLFANQPNQDCYNQRKYLPQNLLQKT